jgi:hypothetical protein
MEDAHRREELSQSAAGHGNSESESLAYAAGASPMHLGADATLSPEAQEYVASTRLDTSLESTRSRGSSAGLMLARSSLEERVRELEQRIAEVVEQHRVAMAELEVAHALKLEARVAEITTQCKAEMADEKARCVAVLHHVVRSKSQDGSDGETAIGESTSTALGAESSWQDAARLSRAEGNAIVHEFDRLREQVSKDFVVLKEAARKAREAAKDAGTAGLSLVSTSLSGICALVDDVEATGEILVAELAPTVVSALDRECEAWRLRALSASNKVAELQRRLVDAEEVAFVKLDEVEAEAEERIKDKIVAYENEISRWKEQCEKGLSEDVEGRKLLASVQATLELVTGELTDCLQLFACVEELAAQLESEKEQHRLDMHRLEVQAQNSLREVVQKVAKEKQEIESYTAKEREQHVQDVSRQIDEKVDVLVSQWEDQRKDLTQQIKVLENQLSTAQALAEQGKSNAERVSAEYEANMQRLMDEAEAAREQKDNLEEELTNLRGELHAMQVLHEAERTRLHAELAAIKSDFDEQITAVRINAEEEMASVRRNAEDQISAAERDAEEQIAAARMLAEEANARMTEDSRDASKCAQLQQERLQADIAQLRSELASVQGELANARVDLGVARGIARDLCQDMRECCVLLSQACDCEHTTLQEIRAMAKHIDGVIGGLNTDSDVSSSSLSADRHTLLIDNADASRLCRLVQNAVDKLQDRASEAENRDRDAKDDASLWQQRMESLAEQLRDKKVTWSSVCCDVPSLVRCMSALGQPQLLTL